MRSTRTKGALEAAYMMTISSQVTVEEEQREGVRRKGRGGEERGGVGRREGEGRGEEGRNGEG